MRIVILGSASYIPLQYQAEKFSKKGHEVFVVSLQKENVKKSYSNIYLSVPPIFHFVKIQYLASIVSVWKIIKNLKPDIIDIHCASSYGLYALLPFSQPIVLKIHGNDIYDHAKRYRIVRWYARKAIQRADALWGSSIALREYITQYMGINISHKAWIRSYGIPLAEILSNAEQRRHKVRRELNISPNKIVILHNRHLHPFWRIDQLVEAIPMMLIENPNVEVWFAYPPLSGHEQKYMNKLKNKLQQLGVSNVVRWLGHYPYEQMISIMHAADLYVCIGKDDLLASSVLEAMAAGLVPVLAELPAYQEVIQDNLNGFFIQEINSPNIANKINTVVRKINSIRPEIVDMNRALLLKDHERDEFIDWLIERFQKLVIGNEIPANNPVKSS